MMMMDFYGATTSYRGGRKRSRTAGNQDSEEEDYDHDEEEESSGSSAMEKESKNPLNFKVLYLTGKKSKPKAVQRIINGDEKPPFTVMEIFEPYVSQSLPEDVLEQTESLDLMCELLEDAVDGLTRRSITEEWIDSNLLTKEELFEKYKNRNLGKEVIRNTVSYIRRAFIGGLVNVEGRNAVQQLFCMALEICKELLGEERALHFCVHNIGGGARTWKGACTIGKLYGRRGQELMKVLERQPLPSNINTLVPDVQMVNEVDVSKSKAKYEYEYEYVLTAEVNSTRPTDSSICQTWSQALIGLLKRDLTYALLLTPVQAQLFEIKVKTDQEKSIRKIVTKSKMYNFVGLDDKFKKCSITDLFKDIVDVIYRWNTKHV